MRHGCARSRCAGAVRNPHTAGLVDVLHCHDRAFGIGPKRFLAFAAKLDEVTAWYTEMLENVDEVYANEKLRRLASRCSGIEVSPLYDKEMTEMVERLEQK